MVVSHLRTSAYVFECALRSSRGDRAGPEDKGQAGRPRGLGIAGAARMLAATDGLELL